MGIARRVLSWVSWLGVGFVALIVLSAATFLSPRLHRAAGWEEAEAEPPPCQRGRDDYGSPVWSLAASPDGAFLGSSTIGGVVWIKDLAAGRSIVVEKGPAGRARSLAFAPDGRVLAVAGTESSVRLWDVREGRLLAAIDADGEIARSVAFAPAGRLLAVGECTRRGPSHVSLWDWRDGRRRGMLDGHAGGVNALAFSADGSLLASGDSTGVVKLWEVASGRELSDLPACRSGTAIAALALSPDGTRLATAGGFEAVVRLWRVDRGQPIAARPGIELAANSLAFSPDGGLLAVACQDGTAALWESSGARALGSVGRRSAAIESVIFSADGRTLATGGADGCLRLWDVTPAVGGPTSARR